jgi:hypothetical protein
MSLKLVTVNGWLKDVNDNFDALEAARVGGVSQVMAPPEGEATSVAITVKSGVVIVPDDGATEAGPIAMTLLDPVAGTDDGKILTIITVAAEEQTLTLSGPDDEAGDPTASKGFNADATKNLATWDGGSGDVAIGDYLRLLAYGGVWHVIGNQDVTLGTAT